MFRRNKKENKAKLEHQLYLARENPEPIFDLSDCGIRDVPSGIYSLCKVFLKQSLHLEHNHLSSLSGGGNLKDLCLLQVLDLHDNAFVHIPLEIGRLVNLLELYLNDNQIKMLPASVCELKKLKLLDMSNNALKELPVNFGNLANLRKLNVLGNKSLKQLPKSLCSCKRLSEILVNSSHFVYPPADVCEDAAESIMKYICKDNGIEYVPPDDLCDGEDVEEKDTVDAYEDSFKEQRLQDFLEIEKQNELLQRQEFEVAVAMKANREKLLTDISQQQAKLDSKLAKVQQLRDTERFQLIEQLQEYEHNADFAISQLLAVNKEPLTQLLEQERLEEERLLAATANQYNEKLHKQDVLTAMQELLEQETLKFTKYNQSRFETAKSILQQETLTDSHLLDVLQNQGLHKAELMLQLQSDVDLQKAAVGALLERGDARSWGLVQQVRMVESQLAALTSIELKRRKLKLDEHVNDLDVKRVELSMMLMSLLQLQAERRSQLLSTLKTMEERRSVEDFWLCQYQTLLNRIPTSISEAQRNIDPRLGSCLLMCGALHCLPFLAYITHTEGDVSNITEDDLEKSGVTNDNDRRNILEAFHLYMKEQACSSYVNTAPSAPLLESQDSASELRVIPSENECVVCMDCNCDIIFVPCGHLCCCVNCSNPLEDCPMCRITIERKIKVYTT